MHMDHELRMQLRTGSHQCSPHVVCNTTQAKVKRCKAPKRLLTADMPSSEQYAIGRAAMPTPMQR